MVTVQGTVERITDEDEFRLADASDSIRIYVGPTWVPAEVGEIVIFNGFVDDDLIGPRTNGPVVTFDRRYK